MSNVQFTFKYIVLSSIAVLKRNNKHNSCASWD